MNKTFMFGIIVFLLLAMPIAIAQGNTSNETTEIKGGKEYPLLQRALDRIVLAFTLQVERRVELMAKIEQRRLEHYNFLVARGKTEQAEAFNNRTVGLIKNFDDWREKKNATVQRFENKTIDLRERMAENNRTMNKTEIERPERNKTRGISDENESES